MTGDQQKQCVGVLLSAATVNVLDQTPKPAIYRGLQSFWPLTPRICKWAQTPPQKKGVISSEMVCFIKFYCLLHLKERRGDADGKRNGYNWPNPQQNGDRTPMARATWTSQSLHGPNGRSTLVTT